MLNLLVRRDSIDTSLLDFKVIILEGHDGSGKSYLANHLKSLGYKIIETKSFFNDYNMSTSDYMEIMKTIKKQVLKSLSKGIPVVLDRYYHSAIVYNNRFLTPQNTEELNIEGAIVLTMSMFRSKKDITTLEKQLETATPDRYEQTFDLLKEYDKRYQLLTVTANNYSFLQPNRNKKQQTVFTDKISEYKLTPLKELPNLYIKWFMEEMKLFPPKNEASFQNKVKGLSEVLGFCFFAINNNGAGRMTMAQLGIQKRLGLREGILDAWIVSKDGLMGHFLEFKTWQYGKVKKYIKQGKLSMEQLVFLMLIQNLECKGFVIDSPDSVENLFISLLKKRKELTKGRKPIILELPIKGER